MRELFVMAGALALGACQGGATPANDAAAPAANATVEAVPPSETAVVETGAGPAAVVPGTIPAALQGRWALVPNDCDPSRGDAKGALTVGADTLTFFEARAKLDKPVTTRADSLTAEFAFTGEGQNWRKTVTLARDGDALVRSEDELPQPLRYQRCPPAAADAPADSPQRGR